MKKIAVIAPIIFCLNIPNTLCSNFPDISGFYYNGAGPIPLKRGYSYNLTLTTGELREIGPCRQALPVSQVNQFNFNLPPLEDFLEVPEFVPQ
jgi:hypothetical protein